MARHDDLAGTALHEAFHYAQDADPGAIGAGLYWLDTNSGPPRKLYRRNAANDGWDEIGGGTGAALTVQEVDGAPLDAAVTIIRVTNGKLTDNGAGDVTLDLSGGGGGAPTDATYVTEDANGTLSAESVLGTTVITTAAHASRQAAAKAGRLFLPTDGGALYRDSGAAWLPWGPLYPLTEPPAVAGWTWVNQSTATAVDSQGGIYMTIPTSAGTNLRCLVRSAPATPYTVTAVFMGLLYAVATNSFGLVHRQSSDGKLTYCEIYATASIPHVAVGNYTSPTAFSALPADKSILAVANPFFLQMEDNGTNRIYRLSHDGVNWTEVYSVARTTFLTADQVGFAVDASNGTNAPAATLASWKIG